jgi:hypothetical protein
MRSAILSVVSTYVIVVGSVLAGAPAGAGVTGARDDERLDRTYQYGSTHGALTFPSGGADTAHPRSSAPPESSMQQPRTYPEIMWWFDLDAPSFGSAAVADIDNDGRVEIAFGTYFNDETIHVLNGENGRELWFYDTGGCNDS